MPKCKSCGKPLVCMPCATRGITSPKKAATARENGKKGGRPRKVLNPVVKS